MEIEIEASADPGDGHGVGLEEGLREGVEETELLEGVHDQRVALVPQRPPEHRLHVRDPVRLRILQRVAVRNHLRARRRDNTRASGQKEEK